MGPPGKPLKPKGKPPTEADEPTVRTRSRGALLGLAVGEAVGVRAAGRNIPHAPFPELNAFPIDGPLGGGPHELRRGQVSWSTQLACALAGSLRAERWFDVKRVGKAYAEWLPHAFEVGETTRLALEQVLEGRSGEYTGRRVYLENGQRPKENDPLVRSVPLAVFLARQRDVRIEALLQEAAITHFAPVCRMASSVLGSLVARALLSPTETLALKELPKFLETEISAAAVALVRLEPDWSQLVKEAHDALKEDLALAQEKDPQLYGPDLHVVQQGSWARTTFRLALWELFHAPDYAAAVLDTANRGGDADANAAVVGAIFGAMFGENAIPLEWRELVLEALQHQGGPLWNTYHPRYLLNLVGVTPEPPKDE